MDILHALFLGVLQGLTEFIPVSSSGHLIVARDLLGLPLSGTLSFDAVLQLATALSIFVYFRKDWIGVLSSLWKKDGGEGTQAYLTALAVATIPAVFFGLVLENVMDTVFRSSAVVALALILGALLLGAGEYLGTHIKRTPSLEGSVLVGVYQAFALIPGMSRSGSTIAGGLLSGLSREGAARFAFMLGFPILFGSGLKKLFDLGVSGVSMPLVAGSLASFFVGLAVIHLLLKYLKEHTLYVFVYYRIALALLALLLL